MFTHYGVKQEDEINFNSFTQGIFDSNTPSICELGAKYKIELLFPSELWFAIQQVNTGNEGYGEDNYASINSDNDSGTITQAAEEAIQQSVEKSQYVNSLVAGYNSKYKNIDLTASIACANTKNISDNEARILKWSVGCLNKCKSKTCFPKLFGIGIQAFGLNVGTPAYLNEDIIRNGITTNKDNTPIVCEVYCVINFCGLNVPIFADFLNHKDNGLISEDKGDALIIGARPGKIFGLECSLYPSLLVNNFSIDDSCEKNRSSSSELISSVKNESENNEEMNDKYHKLESLMTIKGSAVKINFS